MEINTDQGLKEEWIKALRSGEYKQVSGYMRWEAHGQAYYCALGVLCEVAMNRNPYKFVWSLGGRSPAHCYDPGNPMTSVEFGLEIGLTEWQVRNIIKANDGDELSFARIADIIAGMEM